MMCIARTQLRAGRRGRLLLWTAWWRNTSRLKIRGCQCPCDLRLPIHAEAGKPRARGRARRTSGAWRHGRRDRWFTPKFRASGATDAAHDRLLSDNGGAWAQAWRAMSAIDTSARLGAIRVPTLFVAGELDKSSPPEIVAAIAERIAGARFAVISGAPHMLFIEQ
jgi:pimeloyl-ACP methyl ester carboxylesterase